MRYRMKIIDGHGLICPTYLVSFDPDGEDGRGNVVATVDKTKAHVFASFEDLIETWKRPSTVRPVRPDGKPNRPLTAFTIETERVDDAES